MKNLMSFGLVVALAVSLAACSGCASLSGAQHVGAVSVVTSHSVLASIQDTEMLLACGKTGAPPEPQCIPEALHRQIAAKFVTAFDLDGQVARIVRDLPAGQPQPADVAASLLEIARLVQSILADLPASPQKATLTISLEAK